jgi:hypothetical protein
MDMVFKVLCPSAIGQKKKKVALLNQQSKRESFLAPNLVSFHEVIMLIFL